MTVAAPIAAPSARRPLLADVAIAGLAGGAVDLVYASAMGLLDGRGVARVWQSVAGGWIGPAAFDGGPAAVGLGVATHFAIAAAMAAAFAVAALRVPVLLRRPGLSGALYGLALYAVMYGLVLPLRWPEVFPRWNDWKSVADIAAHVGVGLAIAFVLKLREARGR